MREALTAALTPFRDAGGAVVIRNVFRYVVGRQAVNRPPLHHVGYVVDDIPAAVDWAVSALGAGPFFLIDHLPFDSVTFHGEPAAYDHSSAFGQWGSLKLELTVVHDAQPAGLADALGGPPGRVGHVAWVVADLEAESARLAAAGVPRLPRGPRGPGPRGLARRPRRRSATTSRSSRTAPRSRGSTS